MINVIIKRWAQFSQKLYEVLLTLWKTRQNFLFAYSVKKKVEFKLKSKLNQIQILKRLNSRTEIYASKIKYEKFLF